MIAPWPARVASPASAGAPNVAGVTFAGPGLDRLVVTTGQWAGDPDSGRLFVADAGATGLPPTPWAGFD